MEAYQILWAKYGNGDNEEILGTGNLYLIFIARRLTI